MTVTTTNPPSLNPALRDFWMAPARNRVLYGGRASSKSWDAAGFAIFLAQHCKLKFMCARQFQNKIEESVYSLLKIQIERFGLEDQFVILKNKIIHKYTETEFVFYGIWHNVAEIKSTEGIDVLWIEEAQFLTADQWRDLEPTIRKDGSQVWLVFNPQFTTDFVWKRFIIDPPPNTITRKINYDENPFLSADYIRDVIEALRAEDEAEYGHVYLGEPRTSDNLAIIKRDWLMSALDAHHKLSIDPAGSKRIGFDVADEGSAYNATAAAYGPLTLAVDMWKGGHDDLMPTCSRVFNKARSIQASILYDSIGVGAHCGSKFRELNEWNRLRIGYTPFNAGGKVARPESFYQPGVKNKDYFANLKAQTWGLVADRLRATHNAVRSGKPIAADQLIAIASECGNLERLFAELTEPRTDYDAVGRFRVESKKAMAARGVDSPDLADAFVMAYSPVAEATDYAALL